MSTRTRLAAVAALFAALFAAVPAGAESGPNPGLTADALRARAAAIALPSVTRPDAVSTATDILARIRANTADIKTRLQALRAGHPMSLPTGR